MLILADTCLNKGSSILRHTLNTLRVGSWRDVRFGFFIILINNFICMGLKFVFKFMHTLHYNPVMRSYKGGGELTYVICYDEVCKIHKVRVTYLI